LRAVTVGSPVSTDASEQLLLARYLWRDSQRSPSRLTVLLLSIWKPSTAGDATRLMCASGIDDCFKDASPDTAIAKLSPLYSRGKDASKPRSDMQGRWFNSKWLVGF